MRASLLAVLLSIASLTSLSQVINTFPYADDLETWPLCPDTCGSVCVFPNGWSNQGTISFLTDNGGTPTSLTGPTANSGADHNPGTSTGHYIYIESSSPCNPDTAILESPLVDLTGVINPSFSFWYHQYGINYIDSFRLDYSLDSGQTWNFLQYGDSAGTTSNDQWSYQFVDLSSLVGNVIQLRIWSRTNSSFNDFALDDFYFDGIQDIDAGIDSIFSSNGFCAGDTQEVCLKLTNYGILSIDSVTITTTINGAPFNSPYTFYGPLASGADTIICLGQTVLSTGDTIQSYTSLPNNMVDTVTSNDTSTLNTVINPLPNVDAGPDTVVCGLDSVVLGGTPSGPSGAFYNWSPSAFLNDSTLPNPTGYFNAAGTYSYQLSVVDTNGCSGQDSVTVTVQPITSVDAGPDTTVCLNDSIVIGGSPSAPAGFSVLWSPFQFLTNDTVQNPTAFIPANTSFILQVEDSVGCFFYDTIDISTFPGPQLDPGLAQTICLGDTVQLGGSPTVTNYQTIGWAPTGTILNPNDTNPLAVPVDTTIYTVSVIDTFGCDFQESVVVTVVNPPQADAGVDTTVCAFDSFAVGGSPTGSAGMVFSWTPAGLFNDPALANPSLSVTQDTTLIVEVIDTLAGCSTFDTLQVSIHPIPLADAGPAQGICTGDSVTIGGSPTGPPGSAYRWTPGTSVNDSTAANPVFNALDSTWMYLTVTEPVNGCSAVDSVLIEVYPLPQVSAGPGQSVCNGDSLLLGGVPTSPTAASYQWTPVAGLSNDTVANPAAAPNTTTTYTVLVTDSLGCQASDSVLITVDTVPIPVVNSPAPVCFGDSAQLMVSGGDFYDWNNGAYLDDSTSSAPMASPPVTTTFTVVVIDNNGCNDSAQVQVQVNPLPPVSAGQDQVLCNGDTVTLTASGANTYDWTPGDYLDDSTVAVVQAFPPATTDYLVVGTDANGCSDSDTVSVIVNFLPPVEAGPDTALCLNDTVQVGGTPTGPSGSTYQWAPNSFVDSTVANPYFVGNTVGTGFYYVTVTDANGCTSYDSLSVTVYGLPTATIAPVNTTICPGDSLMLQGGGGVSYSWTNNNIQGANTATPTVAPLVSSAYTLTVTDANGCTDTESEMVPVYPPTQADAGPDTGMCQQESVLLQASGGLSYQWAPANGLSSTTVADPLCSTLLSRTYTVTVTDANGCTGTDEVNVVVYPLPTVSGGQDRRICKGGSVQIGGSPTGPSNGQFTWSPAATLNSANAANPIASPSVNTTYRVTVTNSNGCQDSSSVTVRVDSLPQLSLSKEPLPVCKGDSVSVDVTDGFAYVWTPSEGVVNPSEGDATFFPSTTTMYTLTASDTNGCKSTLKVNVKVWPLPAVFADVFPKEICESDSALLEASGGVVYAWSDGATLNDSAVQTPWASPSETMFYTVTATDTNGCANADSVELVVFERPFVNAGADIANCELNVVEIGGDPTGPSDATFVWTPAEGLSDPFDPNPRVVDANQTTFTVEVQAPNGCISRDSVLVNSDCYARIFAPSAFTPGNNGINDEFKLSYYRVIEARLEVFDRHGQLMFRTNDMDGAWDGSYRGGNGQAPAGVYLWKLFYRTDASRKLEKHGTVTLVR